MDTRICCCSTRAFADRCAACQAGVHSRCAEADDCPNDATCLDPHCTCYDEHPASAHRAANGDRQQR